MPEPQNNPKVFISYSHDSQEHKDIVLALSDRLRADGIDCIIDQYETSPPEGWAQWMIKQVKKADFVLIVCTKTYKLRFEGEEEPEKGKGATWEGAIITQELYDSHGKNKKFIPVIFTPEDETHIPIILRSATNYITNTERGYESLYRHLTDQPFIKKQVLGKLKSLPLRTRAQDFHVQPCNVPFQRNPYFTGREEILKQLHNSLKSDKAVALAQAISDLGGIGKTQTAVEYTYRYKSEYSAVLWVKAGSREVLISDYAALAQVLDLPEKDENDKKVNAAAVRRWLDNNSGWLLVFDNADPGLLEAFIPINHKGHILLTSSAYLLNYFGISKSVELEKMPLDEAKEFLMKRTGRTQLTQEENEAILKIAKELDYLPLALEQAGAYIKELNAGFANYLSSYRRRGMEMFKKHPHVTGKYPESVATTWLLNFEQVEKKSKASAELLTASAFFNPDNIPFELIVRGAPELGETISSAIEGIEKDPIVLDKLLLPLTRYSLISYDVQAHTYSIHRLVQTVIKDMIEKDVERVRAERTVKTLNRALTDIDFSNWHLCERLIPHAQAGYELIKKWGFEFVEAALLLNLIGFYEYERSMYSEAESMYKAALEIMEKSLGKDHPAVASLLNILALLYDSQGKSNETELMYGRALQILEKSLGKDHPNVATTLNNLALIYYGQGKFDKAEPMYVQALEIREKLLGKDHPNVVTSVNNLAELYDSHGKYAQAEPMYRRALELYEKSLGEYHPKVAITLNNLALLYKSQGKFAEAEPMYRRALRLWKSMGEEHPNVATTLNNLAGVYEAQGRYDKAETMYRRSLEIREKSLGKDHPHVAISLNNLAGLYEAQRQYDKAETMYRQALEIYEKLPGKDHPGAATTLNNLALLYKSQGKFAEAESMYRRALEIREKLLGKDHPDFATSLINLALLYYAQGKYNKAVPIYRRALNIKEESIGKNEPSVVNLSKNLAVIIRKKDRKAQVEKWRRLRWGYGGRLNL